MPSFNTLEKAERYGEKNYLRPSQPKETIRGNWEIHEDWRKTGD